MSATVAPEPRPSTGDRLVGIELLRFVAALSILIWHFQHFAYIVDQPVDFDRSLQPFYRSLSVFYDFGLFGVQAFWCISGFIFFWKYRRSIYTRRVGLGSFAKARFARLYPLHLATLMVVAALQSIYFGQHDGFFVYQGNDVPHFLLQLGLASNWSPSSVYSFNAPIWSVSAEVLVYASFFFFMRRGLEASTWRMLVIALLTLTANRYFLEYSISFNVVDCLGCFYLGCLSAKAYIAAERLNSRRRRLVDLLAIGIALLAIAWLWLDMGCRELYYVGLCALIFSCCRYIRPSNPHVSKTLETLGNLTYSSYLLHFPCQLVIAISFTMLGAAIPYRQAWFFIAFIFVVLALSLLCFRTFERPLQRRLRG